MPPFPAKYIYETDTIHQVCGQYEIIDEKNFKVRHVKDWPLMKCDGVFGFASSDVKKVLNWCQDVARLAQNKCSGN